MKKRCLLLGGAGFIGKNLAKYLLSLNYELTLYDLRINGIYSEEELKNVNYYERSLFDDSDLDSVVAGHDIVIHLVSSVGPASSMIDPEKCYSNDVAKTVELLETMRRQNVNKMIFLSSGGTVYGNSICDSYSEDMVLQPCNHYGITKVTIERILMMYNQLYNMKNVVLRISNPYGAGQNSNKGIGAVTVFAEKIMQDDEITIWGDGETVRDYIYIDDVVKMIEKFILRDSTTADEIYNIGTGEGISLNSLIKVIEGILGKKAKVQYVQNRGIDVPRNVLNMSKTYKAIGHIDNYSIEQGIRKYLEVMG